MAWLRRRPAGAPVCASSYDPVGSRMIGPLSSHPTMQNRGMMKPTAVVGLLGLLLAACSALPTAGPTASDVKGQEFKNEQSQFALIDIDDNVVKALLAQPSESFRARFK